MTTEAMAWRPTLQELSAMLQAAAAGRINCSHTHYGKWSFWLTGNIMHASLCHKTGAFYLVSTHNNLPGGFGNQSTWSTKGQVLATLGLGFDEV